MTTLKHLTKRDRQLRDYIKETRSILEQSSLPSAETEKKLPSAVLKETRSTLEQSRLPSADTERKLPSAVLRCGPCKTQVKYLLESQRRFKASYGNDVRFAGVISSELHIPTEEREAIAQLTKSQRIADLLQNFGGKNVRQQLRELGPRKESFINSLSVFIQAGLTKDAFEISKQK